MRSKATSGLSPNRGYYLRDGKPCSMTEWCQKLEDEKYRVVDTTNIGRYVYVSTVWLGLDHGFNGKKLIFETMVFNRHGEDIDDVLDCKRYSTEEEAKKGHIAMVEEWTRDPYESRRSIDID